MTKILSALCTLLLFVIFTPATTQADPIFITSGSLTVQDFSAGRGGLAALGAPTQAQEQDAAVSVFEAVPALTYV